MRSMARRSLNLICETSRCLVAAAQAADLPQLDTSQDWRCPYPDSSASSDLPRSAGSYKVALSVRERVVEPAMREWARLLGSDWPSAQSGRADPSMRAASLRGLAHSSAGTSQEAIIWRSSSQHSPPGHGMRSFKKVPT